jgi:hypothetical protein
MYSLDVVGVIVSACATHAFRPLMVGDNIAVTLERLVANRADAFLFDDLAVQELLHLSSRSQLPVPARVVQVFNARSSKAVWTWFSHLLPAATEE